MTSMEKPTAATPGKKPARFIVGREPHKSLVWEGLEADKFQEELDRAEEEKKKRRAKALEIPKEIEPGSADMTWHQLRNTIMLNEESLSTTQGREKERIEKRLHAFKLQQNVLDGTHMGSDRHSQPLSAGEAIDRITKKFIEPLEKELMEWKKPESPCPWYQVSKGATIGEVLDAAKELTLKLSQEAVRRPEKK